MSHHFNHKLFHSVTATKLQILNELIAQRFPTISCQPLFYTRAYPLNSIECAIQKTIEFKAKEMCRGKTTRTKQCQLRVIW